MLVFGKHENMQRTKEGNELNRNREEEPREMEKTFLGEKKMITLFRKIIQSYHPITTIRFLIIDQAHCTYLCMALS